MKPRVTSYNHPNGHAVMIVLECATHPPDRYYIYHRAHSLIEPPKDYTKGGRPDFNKMFEFGIRAKHCVVQGLHLT